MKVNNIFVLSKISKPEHLKSHNLLKVSFSNIRDLRTNFLQCESFLLSQSLDILTLCETNIDDSIHANHHSFYHYLPLIRKDSSTHMHGLGRFVKSSPPFTRDVSLETSKDS